jgi:anti-sigma-K factor RskA
MNIEVLQTFLDRHGADAARWPAHERAAVERLIASDAEARELFEEARRLDAALTRHGKAVQPDTDALARLSARLAGPLPRQKKPFWRLPVVLLDWQFAPAWPRMAALACCAIIGFTVGMTGIDRQFDGQSVTAANGDPSTAMFFEPEPFTEVRP